MASAVFPWEKHLPSGKRHGRVARVPANSLLPFPVAMTVGTRQYLWLRTCPGCQKRYVGLAKPVACSQPCGQAVRAWRHPRSTHAQRRLQRLATAARVRNRDARIVAECAHLTPIEAFRKGYERGYASGHAAQRKGCKRLGAA